MCVRVCVCVCVCQCLNASVCVCVLCVCVCVRESVFLVCECVLSFSLEAFLGGSHILKSNQIFNGAIDKG